MSKEFTKSYAINRITELTEELNKLNDSYNETMKYLNKLRDENNRLKQQLEEKDKEIERFKDFISCKGCVDVIKKSNENQTQHAITELEKVRKEFETRLMGKKWEEKMLVGKVCNVINDVLDNQIKVLKGE